jgi:hypothetical protein
VTVMTLVKFSKCPFYHKKNALQGVGTLPLSNSSWSTVIYIVNNVDFVYIYIFTDTLYGCHLLLDVCIIYFISCDCIMNSSLS